MQAGKLLEIGITHKWITLTILKMKTQNTIPPVHKPCKRGQEIGSKISLYLSHIDGGGEEATTPSSPPALQIAGTVTGLFT